MQSWSEEQKRDFIHHYQSTHFKENNSHSFLKCHFKRMSLFQLLQAAQMTTSNETPCHILKSKLRDYSSVVDKRDGVNNYASGVLELVPPGCNEAQKWTSEVNASELLKEFLQPLQGESHNKIPEGCRALKPTDAEIEALFRNKQSFLEPKSSTSRITQAKSLVNANKPSKRTITQTESSVVDTIGNRVFSCGRGDIFIQTPKPKPPTAPSFRTAGTELRLQNAKKFGQQASSSEGSESSVYGSKKKSLGGRTRSVNSRFVPPVRSNSQEEEFSQLNSCEEEVDDERLRLTDPKLVELILSEIMDHGPPIGWDDIAGLHKAKATIQEIVVLPMLRPDIFTGLLRPSKGILLFGPPGTGKTLIGKCIASQSKSTFFNISVSSLTSKWVGEGEKMIRTLFTLARVHQPAVVFIDEIDSLLSQRSDSEHESSRRIKTEFLVQLDGAGTGEEDRILVIGATNRPQDLDDAARRRFVKRLYIPLPDHEARCHLVQKLMSTKHNVLTEPQLEEIASLTDGYSGADMKTLCQEACLGPIRSLSFAQIQHIAADELRPVNLEDFKAALSCVRASVLPRDLEAYVTWDKTYSSGGAPK